MIIDVFLPGTFGSVSGSTDNSSGAIQPVGDTWRGFGSSWFNAANIAREDWLRDQQSQELAFNRDLEYLSRSNAFSASEAQKNRDWQERLSNTAYQRAVEDMKKAGINPVLAYQQGGASTPSGSSPSSSGSRSSGGYRQGSYNDPFSSVFGSVMKIIAGALTHSPALVVSGITDTVFDSDRNISSTHYRHYHFEKK